jgi:hypothetical protein
MSSLLDSTIARLYKRRAKRDMSVSEATVLMAVLSVVMLLSAAVYLIR